MSKFFSLNTSDLLKGLYMTMGTSVVVALEPILVSGVWPTWTEMKTIALAGLAAGALYLLKNMFTNSEGIVFKTEPK